MSDYCREKVLRYPVNEDPWDIEEKFVSLFNGCANLPTFQVAPTEASFIDYILESDYGCDCGDWGRNRALSESQKPPGGPAQGGLSVCPPPRVTPILNLH